MRCTGRITSAVGGLTSTIHGGFRSIVMTRARSRRGTVDEAAREQEHQHQEESPKKMPAAALPAGRSQSKSGLVTCRTPGRRPDGIDRPPGDEVRHEHVGDGARHGAGDRAGATDHDATTRKIATRVPNCTSDAKGRFIINIAPAMPPYAALTAKATAL